MLDNKQLDRAERESVVMLQRLFKDSVPNGLNTFSLLSAMFVRGWMAAVLYLEDKNARE